MLEIRAQSHYSPSSSPYLQQQTAPLLHPYHIPSHPSKIMLNLLCNIEKEFFPLQRFLQSLRYLSHTNTCTFVIALKFCSVLSPRFPLTLKITLCCGTGVVLYSTNTPKPSSGLPCSWCLLHGPSETKHAPPPWPNRDLRQAQTGAGHRLELGTDTAACTWQCGPCWTQG